MTWTYNDGGRALAGFRGTTGDCVVRAIAIATQRPYLDIYQLVNTYHRSRYGTGTLKTIGARAGVRKPDIRCIMAGMGFTWTPTMKVGQGCTVHLRPDELPGGRIVVKLSGHVCAVVDGVVHDTHDCTRGGTRCVYGYWSLPSAAFVT